MRKILLGVTLLIAAGVSAQEYEWQWAKRGGGLKPASNENSAYDFNSEQIIDIAVDDDNNDYYLAFITQQNTQYEDIPITVYNPQMQTSGMTDVVLISTNCQGDFRWSQTIGGGSDDYGYKIVLDNAGGLYIGMNILNISSALDEYLPPRFSENDAMPIIESGNEGPQEGFKTIALLKYSTSNGDLEWRKMPQGDVTQSLRWATINQIEIDSEGVLHALIGFAAGTHLNGQVVVPNTFNSSYKYYVVKYNSSGDIIGATPLPLDGILLQQHTDFGYDENLERYYIAGFRTNGDINFLYPLNLNGSGLQQAAYVMAFNNTGTSLWLKEFTPISTPADNRVYALEIDQDSNFYIAGKYKISPSNPGISFGNYQLPVTLGGNVMFVMKLNSDGVVQWVKTPSGYSTDNGLFSGAHHAYSLVLNGNELAVATEVSNEIWGNVVIDRPTNHLTDPGLLRLNKNTGEAIALHDIMTTSGSRDGLTAVAVDMDGNYITGGYFYKDLFTLENDNVPTVTKVGGVQDFTDFFVAKLAAGECGTLATNKTGYNTIKVYPNPTFGMINIQSQEELRSYEVVNLLGQVLLKGQLKEGQNSIMIESLSTGTFILNITTADGKVISRKVVKQ